MKNFLKFDFVTLASVIISCIVLLSPAAIYAQDSIERLREEEKSILPNTNHKPDQSNSLGNEEKLAALTQELNKTKEDLKNTNAEFKILKDSISANFINSYTGLVDILITTIGIALGLLGVLLAWVMPKIEDRIKNKVIKAHRGMLTLTENRVSARVLTDFSAHCIYLYKDIDKSDVKYKNYLDMAISLSGLGFNKAKYLTDDNPLTDKEDKIVKNACLNNRIYYLLERGTEKDKLEAEKHFKDLQDVANKHEESLAPGWWSVKETLAWAMLKLYPDKKDEIKKIIQSLLTNSKLDATWVSNIRNKWEKIDRFYTE